MLLVTIVHHYKWHQKSTYLVAAVAVDAVVPLVAEVAAVELTV